MARVARPVQVGEVIDYLNASGVPIRAGDIVEFDSFCGVAETGIRVDEYGAVAIGRIWEVSTDEAERFEIGDIVYWDGTQAVRTAGGATPLGVCTAPKEVGEDVVAVKIGLVFSGAMGGGGVGGTPGQAATIRIGKVTTVAAEQNADVKNSGTSNAAVLDFDIPRGADGASGRDGTPGTNGRDGAPGADGRDGADGKDGIDGKDGATPTLVMGTVSQVAPAAPLTATLTETTPGSHEYRLSLSIPAGAQGENAVAALNPRGQYSQTTTYVKNDYVTASSGDTYVLFADTSTGQDPTTTTGIWQLIALRGAKGEPGAQGPPGNKGDPGSPGADGRNGVDGRDGVDGLNGRNGVDGRDGTPGRDGADGRDGTPGRNGVDGKSAFEAAQEGGYTGTEADFNAALLAAGWLKADGDGTKYLADDGTYKEVAGGGGGGNITISAEPNNKLSKKSDGFYADGVSIDELTKIDGDLPTEQTMQAFNAYLAATYVKEEDLTKVDFDSLVARVAALEAKVG